MFDCCYGGIFNKSCYYFTPDVTGDTVVNLLTRKATEYFSKGLENHQDAACQVGDKPSSFLWSAVVFIFAQSPSY